MTDEEMVENFRQFLLALGRLQAELLETHGVSLSKGCEVAFQLGWEARDKLER